MWMKLPIYLDYQSTTPVEPEVLSGMLPYFSERFGNSASRSHEFGWVAEAAVERSRAQIAALIGADEAEVIFTGGATESANLALIGLAQGFGKGHILTTQTEHPAVLNPCRYLENQGFQVTYLGVDHWGRVDPQSLENAIRPDTILISVIAANNEVGTLNPIRKIGQIAKSRGVIFHSDATQAVGKIPVHVDEWGVDLLTFSAHKMYGPKGVGGLYARRRAPRVKLSSMIHGGGHEKGLRAGSLNVPAIVGFGIAAELAAKNMTAHQAHLSRLRDRFREGLLSRLDGVQVYGYPTERLPDNLSVSFDGVDGQALILGVRELAVSSGSACMSASLEPSHVLLAMGVSPEAARSVIRISVGRPTLEAEVDYAILKLCDKVSEFRRIHYRESFSQHSI